MLQKVSRRTLLRGLGPGTKILQILFISVALLAWNGDLSAFPQQKALSKEIALIAAANGAALGAFSVGFIQYHSEWFRLCNSMRSREFSLQGFIDLVRQYATQYPWEEHGRKILGPALGATAGLVLANQLQGHAGGNTLMALGGGIIGVGMGLSLGCLRAQIPRGISKSELLFASTTLALTALFATSFYNPQIGSELLSMPTALVFAAVFAISFLQPSEPIKLAHVSRQPISLVPTMAVTLWSLRF